MKAAQPDASGSRRAELERVRRDYNFAFVTYRMEGTEHRLQAAYELGRKAMGSGLSLLDLSTIHHDVVAEALLAASDDAAIEHIAAAASAFFVEVLSTFEMAQRGFAELLQSRDRRATEAQPEGHS